MYVHRFYVIGDGEFPFDMLRYDSCYPVTGEAVLRMSQNGDRRCVELASRQPRGLWRPTESRWMSFGWTAVYDGVQRLPR